MLILKNIVCPTENILISLNEVVAHWEKDCLGKGNLILTERFFLSVACLLYANFTLGIYFGRISPPMMDLSSAIQRYVFMRFRVLVKIFLNHVYF